MLHFLLDAYTGFRMQLRCHWQIRILPEVTGCVFPNPKTGKPARASAQDRVAGLCFLRRRCGVFAKSGHKRIDMLVPVASCAACAVLVTEATLALGTKRVGTSSFLTSGTWNCPRNRPHGQPSPPGGQRTGPLTHLRGV